MKTTQDSFLGGRLTLTQPARGYRAAIDPVLLAASIAAAPGQHVLELGAGIGTASLCLARRVPGLRVTGLELLPDLADLATRNAAANRLKGRVRVRAGDLLAPPPGLAGPFDHVMANPPYYTAAEADPSPDPLSRAANIEGAALLADWVAAAAARVARRGSVTFIHRAERLTELAGLLRARVGAVTILPLWPRPGEVAKRVLVRAIAGSRAGDRLLPGLALHDGQGYSAPARNILRDGAALAWSQPDPNTP